MTAALENSEDSFMIRMCKLREKFDMLPVERNDVCQDIYIKDQIMQ